MQRSGFKIIARGAHLGQTMCSTSDLFKPIIDQMRRGFVEQ
jgi:hypothetical protein